MCTPIIKLKLFTITNLMSHAIYSCQYSGTPTIYMVQLTPQPTYDQI